MQQREYIGSNWKVMTPTISVVMSVYNGAPFLGKAIESILSQSFSDFEFIIINDGSTDDTASILESYAGIDTRIRIFSHKNKGLTESLNLGCALARGMFVARMDADDIAIKDRLLLQVQFMEAHPNVGLLGGAFDLIDANGKILCTETLPVEDREIRRALVDSTAFLHPSVLMRKQVLDEVGGYREVTYAEDYDLWLRMSEHTLVANLPKVILQYRIHPDQISVSKCREQTLWTGATQVAALFRKEGKKDPLDSLQKITPTILEDLGVSKGAQQSALARGYLRYIRNMCRINEFSLALEALKIVHSDECEGAERWIIADSYLWAARISLKKKSFLGYGLNICQAFVIRPLILARPFRSLLQSLTKLLQKIVGKEGKIYLFHKDTAREEII
jgi:glycosyltransferase involved in cell wall biosynthesis